MTDHRPGDPLDPAQVETLVAVIDHGSFDAAARHLAVTPSAVSQRIRALEAAVGAVLVRRSSPCAATVAGEPVVRYVRQLALLCDDAASDLTGDGLTRLAIAVDPDSLDTWFTPVLEHAASWPDVLLEVRHAEAADCTVLLQRGEIAGAR